MKKPVLRNYNKESGTGRSPERSASGKGINICLGKRMKLLFRLYPIPVQGKRISGYTCNIILVGTVISETFVQT